MNRPHDYWDYYKEEFGWPDGAIQPDLGATRQMYSELGIPPNEAEELIASGYINVHGETIIDRYYGGALLSSDGLTRIHKRFFREWYQAAKAGEPLCRKSTVFTTATSLDDLEKQVRQIEKDLGTRLLFRGQTSHHETTRLIKNPNHLVKGLGEVSLIPSVWRNLLNAKPSSFHQFYGLDLPQWSKIIYSQFDIKEINRRAQGLIERGEWIYSAQDMEDSDDPMLSIFGRVRMDLDMGLDYNLADLLNTLLQHYGLVSPYLDLTSDLRVALFFSSHQFFPTPGAPRYRFVGSNGSKSILYVFKHDMTEMADYVHDRVLHNLQPLRPKHQSCIICRSGPYALNLAALYLVGAIRIDFELPATQRWSTRELFPNSGEDTFLAAMLSNCQHPERITDFRH